MQGDVSDRDIVLWDTQESVGQTAKGLFDRINQSSLYELRLDTQDEQDIGKQHSTAQLGRP